jgi:hypothetical protein
MGTFEPEGDEPFNLPLAREAQAFGNGDVVTLSFRCGIPLRRSDPKSPH